MEKKISILIILSIFIHTWFFASTIDEVVPAEFVEELVKTKNVRVIHEEEDNSLSLVPLSHYREEIINSRIEKKDSPYTAEFLYLISKKELLAGAKDGQKSVSEISIENISEIFTALSNMSGMCYRFSESDPDGIVLYKKVCTLEKPQKDKVIPDEVTKNCDGKKIYCYQQDRLLGNLVFVLNYKMNQNELYLSIKNLSNLGLFGIKACRKENLKINIHVTDCGDDFIFYISADANYENILKMFSIRRVIKKLMNERLDAIYRWFYLQF